MAFGRKRKVVPFRSAGELDAMAAAGAIVGAALVAVRDAAKPGVSTLELDRVAEAVIRDAGAVPSFLGYHGFTGSICSSVNDRVVHGIPSARDVLAAGDIISIDCRNTLIFLIALPCWWWKHFNTVANNRVFCWSLS